MSTPIADIDSDVLRSVLEHVFMPPRLPQEGHNEKAERELNVALCRALIEAARCFLADVPYSQRPLWGHMIKMMESLRRAAKFPFERVTLQHNLANMKVGDVFVMHVRAQNAAVIVRRALVDFVQFEVFEVLPPPSAVMSVRGKLLCSYPGPAIQIPTHTFTNGCFLQELSSFLVQMDVDILDSAPTTSKAGSVVHEVRASAHPKYISELLVGILRGFGQAAVVDRITKRISDEVLWEDAYIPWRRSALWLVLRVSLQTSLRATNNYKPFMLFFHSYLLRNSLDRNFSSELLYTMRAKVARRHSKLRLSVPQHIYNFVYSTTEATEALLQQRWTDFQALSLSTPSWLPDTLDPVADSTISLGVSYSHLEKMLHSTSCILSNPRFAPSHISDLPRLDFKQFTEGRLAEAIVEDGRIALADFELSVENHLESWTGTSLHDGNAPEVIASCIVQYLSGAKDLYEINAEDNSVMILTILALWAALDACAIQQCPLLKQYSPEIPANFVHSLLVHRCDSLKRASLIEEYLCRRHKEAQKNLPSIFSNNTSESSFSVQYFRSSERLQRLYDDINTSAHEKRAEKRAELATLNQRVKSLIKQAASLDHEHIKDSFGNQIHTMGCKKCKLEQQSKSVKIHAHEWPLPSSILQAQQTVFEVSPPPAFSIWRDTTYMVLRDLAGSEIPDSPDKPKVLLDAFSGLKGWVVLRPRITIGSMTKSFLDNTHYRAVAIPAEESSVMVNNGLSFRLFDRNRKSWVVDLSAASVEKLCTPPLPTSSPYASLHHAVSRTQHSSNEIIAAQADCPKELTIHEFFAYSGLRCGPRLQWLNIARELASPSLSFRREEVHVLITQAAWQLGPLSEGVRDWHVDLSIPNFGKTILRELDSLMEKIRANWLEEVTVCTVALICSRLIASAIDPEVCQGACALLRKARDLTYQWISDLSVRLGSAQDESSRESLRCRLCRLAATCFSTFDVSLEHIPAIFSSSTDLSIAIQCAIIVHDNKPSSLAEEGTSYLTRMFHRHHRLLHFLEPIFSFDKAPTHLSLSRADGYDGAVSSLWPGFRRSTSSKWCMLPKPNKAHSRWISCMAEGRLKIHYNILSGQLLIDGKPLGKLPQEIIEHPTYADILGTRVLDVVPADLPGMEFMTRFTVSGYQTLFSRQENGDITLQARQPGASQLLQLVPRSTLSGDFPRPFIDEYFHWLDLSTGEVEFRPVGSPWTSSPSNWRLYVQNHSAPSHVMLCKRTSGDSPIYLVDIRSATFKMVSSLLSSLETPEHIIVSRTEKVLEVSLPRLHLSFFVNEISELECQSLPGYVVDETQSIGTMFGLKTRLVLCPSRASSEGHLLPRRLIIPQGNVSFTQQGDFARASIDTGVDKHVRWHEYIIDADLRCLTTNAGLNSKLYACYLHALTSHCLPDPLLGHTGTEEALSMLQSAPCRSFQRLDPDSEKFLKLIANLSPNRVYYPAHLTSMVTVMWNKLPALSQHHDFYTAVCSILHHARVLEALYDNPRVLEISNRNQLILDRVVSQNHMFYTQDLRSVRQQTSSNDVRYKSRDVPDATSAELVAHRTSWSIWNSKLSLDQNRPNLWDLLNSYGSLGPASTVVSMRYSRYWLEFDAAQDWLTIYELCRKMTDSTDLQDLRIKLSFSLSAASFSKSKRADVVPFIAVIATEDRFRGRLSPSETSYKLSHGVFPSLAHLRDLISECALPIHLTPANSLKVQATKKKKIERRRKIEYEEMIKKESLAAAQAMLSHWPNYLAVEFPEQWFYKSDCHGLLAKHLQSISRNIQLQGYVMQLQGMLQPYYTNYVPTLASYAFTPCFIASASTMPSYSIRDVLAFRIPLLTREEPPLDATDLIIASTATRGSSLKPSRQDGLQSLIQELQHGHEPLLRLYGNDLAKSLDELTKRNASQLAPLAAIPSHDSLRHYRDECSRRKDKLFLELSATLIPIQGAEKILVIAGLWPRITPRSLLCLLARNRIGSLPDQWKAAITRYAVAFLKYQQSQRLLELAFRQSNETFFREAKTICEGVAAESTHDWLLIQIEANVLARQVQISIAHEMVAPNSNRSISLQLNMGEGKSSVIIPLVASTLADGSNLVRVVTPKPLSNQMFELLVRRLSGMADRPVFYVPFSRSLRLDTSLVGRISDLYRRCVSEGGVLVVQPEHILSQKLMRINFLLTSHRKRVKTSVANDLGVLEDWVTSVSRDVLDESDDVLHVRYQLVYTTGEQMPVDDHPNRWVTTQEVLGQLKVHAMRLRSKYPKTLEFNQTQRGFPTMRILDRTISQEISSLIVDDALGGTLSTLPLVVLPPLIKETIRRFVVNKHVTYQDRELVFSHCARTNLLCGILLLRGLLVDGEGILGYVLEQRRWRVDYGLDPSRTLLAVPYRAKDVPSLRAEFGHPDVAITLTCLSYYYGGLTKDQVLQCFDMLVKLDDPEKEYHQWGGSTEDLPAILRNINAVNTQDETMVDELLVPLFTRNMRVVDFYLSRVVFPRSAREFSSKLPTSAWDLVEDKANITTGFSGTNDDRYLLPTSITQEDPVSELGTNALVLRYLLQPENDFYECVGDNNGEHESAAAFLQRLVKKDPEIRVLLDVGAQMLELQNEDLVRHWLSLRPDVMAAVFFNDSDHLTVLTQSGSVEPFISSPFNRQLEKCVVYLDDAHTRGTDLKLPPGTRAAVTLGPKVTKDRLIQGCMRMRQLGKRHSVMFFAPAEVDRCIRCLIPRGEASETHIRVLDVLRWAIHETCEDIRRHLPHWAQQGLDHRKRFAACREYSSKGDIDTLRDAWMQAESRTLEQTYDPIIAVRGARALAEINGIPALRERIEQLAVIKSIDVRMAEEQEREVDHEMEMERQVEPPVKVQPAQDTTHKDIRTFVETGRVPSSSSYICSLFVPTGKDKILDSTTEWCPSPLATAGFATTTTHSVGTSLTDYLRPVNWILSSGSGKDSTVIVISPYEANELLPTIRKSRDVRLHIYAPRVAASMRSFSDLTFYTIPSAAETWTAPAHVRTLLNLFSGQLYFDSREEYVRVCVLLGLHMAHPGAAQIEVDGFVLPPYQTGERSPFITSVIAEFKQLTGLRRKGMGYGGTDLGRVLNARPLGNGLWSES